MRPKCTSLFFSHSPPLLGKASRSSHDDLGMYLWGSSGQRTLHTLCAGTLCASIARCTPTQTGDGVKNTVEHAPLANLSLDRMTCAT